MIGKNINLIVCLLMGSVFAVMVTACIPQITDVPTTVSIATKTVVVLSTTTPKTSTQTPTLIPTQVVETVTPRPTFTPSLAPANTPPTSLILDDYLLFIESYGRGYSMFDYSVSQQWRSGQPFPLSALDYSELVDSDDPGGGAGDARLLTFAHFIDNMAYWLIEGDTASLWLSDLEIENPRLLYTDENQIYADDQNNTVKFNVLWTPDDLHLIWSSYGDSSGYIYHFQNDTIEPWTWHCDRIAHSPETHRLATWCAPEEAGGDFAIIEWGGEIWYSETPPDIELVRQDESQPFLPPVWAWSSDGQTLAYFDPNDPEGNLYIIDSEGNEKLSFPNVAWWFTDAVMESHMNLPGTLFQWAEDSNSLVIFAYSMIEDACPPYENMWSPVENSHNTPCWQLLDMQSGDVLWTWGGLINIYTNSDSSTWQAWDIAISPHGTRLAIDIIVSSRVELGIMDIENGMYEQWGAYGGDELRWKSNE